MTHSFLSAGRRLAGVLAVALALLPFAHAQTLVPIDRPVAVVEEDVVLRSELDHAVANIKNQYANHPDQLPPEDVLERQVLERLVLNRLQVKRATDSGIKVTDRHDLASAMERLFAADGPALLHVEQDAALL